MKYLFTLFLVSASFLTYAQSIIGQWETFDDKTNEKKAIVEIYKTDDHYFAKIVKSYISDENAVCDHCKGQKKDKPIVGLIIIENIKEEEDKYSGGSILDPENGKTYKCYLELVDDNKLKVRGYLGFSLLGRTQYWLRKH